MLKKVLLNLKDNFKEYISNHIGTNIALLITTILIIIIDIDNPKEFITKAILATLITAMFALLAECFTKNRNKRYIIYIIGIILSIIISIYLLEEELLRYTVGIITSTICIILYLMINNTKETTNKYLTNAFTNLVKLEIVGLVINIGIMLILGLISTLLIELEYDIFFKLQIIILILYYIPALIISLETIEKTESKFIYKLINYISLPLISIAIVIIYIYILKLILTLKLPKTATFGMNAITLLLGIPIVLMVLSYNKDNISYKIASILKVLYIPLLLLQIFSLTLRILEYSITTSRYICIILLILGIISVILLNINNGNNYKLILIPLTIISIITFMFPYINIIDFPNYMQINRLEKILPEGKKYNQLNKKEKEEVESIIEYVYEEKYYPTYINRKELEKQIDNNYEYDNYYKEKDYIHYRNKKDKINISNYNEIESYSYSSNKKLIIKVNNNEYDLTTYCKNIYSYYVEHNEINNYIDDNLIVELNENTHLYIKELDLEYKNKYIYIDGYILYK